ncbi:MAG: hypothetical protein C5B53_06305 [Candidatus Melainabacteria bacterium]|nr:MAG: hypothetical protein C5B53_06305 [Candidatus Melainabacteria bacterium]
MVNKAAPFVIRYAASEIARLDSKLRRSAMTQKAKTKTFLKMSLSVLEQQERSCFSGESKKSEVRQGSWRLLRSKKQRLTIKPPHFVIGNVQFLPSGKQRQTPALR